MSQQINLYSPVFLVQKKVFSLRAMLQGVGLIALGAALFYGYALYRIHILKTQNEETRMRLDAETVKLDTFLAGYSSEQAKKMLEDELNLSLEKLNAQKQLIETMKGVGIGNTAGYSAAMRALARETVYGLWLTRFDIGGSLSQMTLEGGVLRPELLSSYIHALSQEEAMRGIAFASLSMERTGKNGYAKFRLQSGAGKEAAKP